MVVINFYDKEDMETFLQVSALNDNSLLIDISGITYMAIKLDKETAIKLSKEIRRQISFLKD